VDSSIAEILAYYLITPSPPPPLALVADPLLELALLILWDYDPTTLYRWGLLYDDEDWGAFWPALPTPTYYSYCCCKIWATSPLSIDALYLTYYWCLS